MRSMAQRHAATNVTPLPESAATMAATHTRTSRQQRARDLLPWLLALLALGATLYLGGRGAAADPGMHTLRQAQMAPGDAAAEAAWRPVELPETWARHGLGRSGPARYRLTLRLAQAPSEVWTLRIERLSTHAALRVNGVLLRDTLRSAQHTLRRPVPTLITVPAGLLHGGDNLIEIEQNHGARGGLSPLVAGPLAALEADFVSGHHRETGTAQWLNVASIGACLVALLVWWRRPGELALGSFAALGLVASLRNFAYYEVGSALPRALSDWIFFSAQVLLATLLGLFASALAGPSSARQRRPWLLGGGLLALAGSVAAVFDALQQARLWLYPLLLLALLAALWRVAQAARRLPGRATALLAGGLGGVFIAGVHDYLYQQGRTSVMDAYWMPYAVPIAVLGFTAMLVRRVVDGLHGVELANQALEQRVAARTAELQQANAAKGRFIAAASHDLRQPVASIGLLVGLLRDQAQAAPLRALIERIDQGVAALESLLKGLLDLSRLDAGTVPAQLAAVPLQPLFDAIAAHEAASAAAKGLTLRFRASGLSVRSDALLLEQMLRNLVGNALRCTARGGVLVAARRRGEQVLLQVWDSGRGLTPAQQATAFDEFVQFDGDRAGAGLGLGLAIVQRSARLLGHGLQLRSQPGRGSCFAIELPRERRARPRASAAPPLASRPLESRQVLLVEDQTELREALRLRLQQWGAQVQAYADVAAVHAQHGAATAPPADLLLTDLCLSDGDGLELIDWLRTRHAGLPALLVTGSAMAGAQLQRAAHLGVPVLAKPFRADALLRALQPLLAARPLRAAAPADVAHAGSRSSV